MLTNHGSGYFGTLNSNVGSLYMQAHSHTNSKNHTHSIQAHAHMSPFNECGNEAQGYGLVSVEGNNQYFRDRVEVSGGNTQSRGANHFTSTGMAQTNNVGAGFYSQTAGSGLTDGSNIMAGVVVAYWVRTSLY